MKTCRLGGGLRLLQVVPEIMVFYRKPREAIALLMLVLLTGGAVGAESAAGKWEGILKHNPFYNEPEPPPNPPEPPPAYEFRGMLIEGGERFFSLHDLQTKKARWVRMNDPDAPVKLVDYLAAESTLLIATSAGTQLLAMKRPMVAAGGSRQMVASNASPSRLASPGQVASAPPISEQQRIEQVATRIRERREQRALRLASANAGKG